MKQSEKERQVMRDAKRLPKEIQPEHDLWPAICSVIAGTRQPRAHDRAQSRVVAWRMAAAVALIAFSSLTTLWVSRGAVPQHKPIEIAEQHAWDRKAEQIVNIINEFRIRRNCERK